MYREQILLSERRGWLQCLLVLVFLGVQTCVMPAIHPDTGTSTDGITVHVYLMDARSGYLGFMSDHIFLLKNLILVVSVCHLGCAGMERFLLSNDLGLMFSVRSERVGGDWSFGWSSSTLRRVPTLGLSSTGGNHRWSHWSVRMEAADCRPGSCNSSGQDQVLMAVLSCPLLFVLLYVYMVPWFPCAW